MATGTLLPLPRLTALDATGVALPGAKLTVYEAGTSSLATTYSDVALTISNANPLIASSAGLFGPIYLATGTSVKVVLTTSADALVWSQDNISAVPGITTTPPIDNTAADLRLSLTSGLPVTTSDVTAATVIYVIPYCGNRLAVYSGSEWNLRTVVETGIAVPNVASTCHDVFAYDNSGTLGFELVAWTNDTTRATALVYQDGILVKSAATTRRYLGTFRTTAVAGQTEDSRVKRYLSNYHHRHRRPLLRQESTASWTYSTATIRQARADTANQVDVVIGVADALLAVWVSGMAANSVGGVALHVGIGEDVTNAWSLDSLMDAPQAIGAAAESIPLHAMLVKYPAVGRHVYAWLEYSGATPTTTWYGAGTSGTGWFGTGMMGFVEG